MQVDLNSVMLTGYFFFFLGGGGGGLFLLILWHISGHFYFTRGAYLPQ